MNQLFSFQGSKMKYLDIINPLIIKSKTNIYIEPFLGTSVIFLNLKLDFDKYYLNDLNHDVLLPYLFKDIDIESEYNRLITDWHRNIEDAGAYTKFRTRDLMGSNYNTIERFIYFLFYVQKAYHGNYHWGGKQFNDSYSGGSVNKNYNAPYIPNWQECLNIIKERFDKLNINNLDIKEFLSKIENEVQLNENTLFIIDPPYINSYWSSTDDTIQKSILSFINKHNKCKYIYFDYYNISLLKEYLKIGFHLVYNKKKRGNTMNNKEMILTNII